MVAQNKKQMLYVLHICNFLQKSRGLPYSFICEEYIHYSSLSVFDRFRISIIPPRTLLMGDCKCHNISYFHDLFLCILSASFRPEPCIPSLLYFLLCRTVKIFNFTILFLWFAGFQFTEHAYHLILLAPQVL